MDADVGRFISRDPILTPQMSILKCLNRNCSTIEIPSSSFPLSQFMIHHPQTLHPYVYVQNNPVNLVDPTGLEYYEDCMNRCGTAVFWIPSISIGVICAVVFKNILCIGAGGVGGIAITATVCNFFCKDRPKKPRDCPPKGGGFGLPRDTSQ